MGSDRAQNGLTLAVTTAQQMCLSQKRGQENERETALESTIRHATLESETMKRQSINHRYIGVSVWHQSLQYRSVCM